MGCSSLLVRILSLHVQHKSRVLMCWCTTAIVTHKGAAADAGHYMAFVKKRALHDVDAAGAFLSPYSAVSPILNKSFCLFVAASKLEPDDEDWYKFDDNKVSLFPAEKLSTLDGGGEDSSAYVLLYRTRSLA